MQVALQLILRRALVSFAKTIEFVLLAMVSLSVYALLMLMAPVPPTLPLPIAIMLPVPQRVRARFQILTALLQHQLVLGLSASAITDSPETNAQPQSILQNARARFLPVLRGHVQPLENVCVLLEKLE